MTTVAWDGKTMAADTLSSDGWGLKDNISKIYKTDKWFAGAAGETHNIRNWFELVKHMDCEEVIKTGVPGWNKENNDPSIILVERMTGTAWKIAGGVFLKINRNFHAIGSGRDYALTAMYLRNSAVEAVQIAAVFDLNTGGAVETEERQ